MTERIQSIEEIQNKRNSGEITDAAMDAIMQAAMNRAGAQQDANAVQQTQEASEVEGVQSANSVSGQDDNKGRIFGATDDKEKSTEKMLTSSMDQLALNNLNNLNFNPNRGEQAKNTLNQTMMQVAMDKANPVVNQSADKDMANVAQGTTAIADTAKKDETSIHSQQVYETGDSAKMQEAKESGLSVGVRIEQPDATNKESSPEQLLSSSMDQLAMNNQNDLSISSGGGEVE